jgi:hypothetical protein
VPAVSWLPGLRARHAAVALLAASGLAAPVAADAARPFAQDSYVNRPLAPNAPLDPRSDVMVEHIRSSVRRHGSALMTGCFSTQVWIVKRRQRTVRVATDPDRERLAAQWAKVPLPRRARAACGTDGHLVVWQPSTDTLWEFFRFRRRRGAPPFAEYGGRMANASRNPGHFTDPPGSQFGATATSIPLLAGLQRISELRAGAIDHAVSFSIPTPAPCYRWPAQRQDTRHAGATTHAPPEGARLRLPAGLDLESLGLTPYGLMLARAVQRYGLVLRDRSDKLPVLYAEVPHGTRDPYAQIFGDQKLDHRGVLANWPWDRLQVLAPPRGEPGCRGLSPQTEQEPPVQPPGLPPLP